MDFPKSDKPLNVQDELKRLHEENARLKALLAQHGIVWEEPTTPDLVAVPQELAPVPSHFTIQDKIVLFRRLFRGREDVYPLVGVTPAIRKRGLPAMPGKQKSTQSLSN